jgi:hypothetical protein
MPVFKLQFDLDRVPELAARFPSEGDGEILAVGRMARDRGYYTLAEFRRACRWKTPRSAPLVAKNTARSVRAATSVALGPAEGERGRIESLLSLRGVGWPTASVLLHIAYPNLYPILDTRALHALGVRSPSAYGFRFWEAYVTTCRHLAEQAGVGGRTLDQALWQWSKEQAETAR